MQIIKQLVATILIVFVTITLNPYLVSIAYAIPTPPAAPDVPVAPSEAPSAPVVPTAPVAPSPEDPSPTNSPQTTPSPVPSIVPETTPTSSPSSDSVSNTGNGDNSNNNSSSSSQTETDVAQSNDANVDTTVVANSVTGNNESIQNVSDTLLITGNTNLTVTAQSTLNENTIEPVESSTSISPIEVINQSNGSDSQNSASTSSSSQSNTTQQNTLNAENNMFFNSNSGDNNASENVGDTAIISGDANLGATVITAANTNLDGVSVAQFDVNDNHTGDIVLSFSDTCAVGQVCAQPVSLANSQNGSNSTNDVSSETISSSNTSQSNSADLTNNLVFQANSGDNIASKNTGGDTIIQTGDANISANVVSFLNNNITGPATEVLIGVVNIFGTLVGDIILPDLDSSSSSASNSGNGSNSSNNTSSTSISESNLTQSNQAVISNSVGIDANTGENYADKNTTSFDNAAALETGDASVDANVINIANNNSSGADWWIVLVNDAGQWIGKIMGATPGASYAGSQGTEFVLDSNGEVIAINNGNGSDSTNNSTGTATTSQSVSQSNTANLANNISIEANTGGNLAQKNTGGSSSVQTGDANVILNVLNFVNNNFSGGGKVVVTVVNVFGSWLGNVITPETQKDIATIPAIGGSSAQDSYNSQATTNSVSASSDTLSATTPQASNPISNKSFQSPNSRRTSTSNLFAAVKGASSNNQTPQNEEDTSIQVPYPKRSMQLGARLDIRWLYTAISLSTVIFLIRRPKALRRIGSFLGLL